MTAYFDDLDRRVANLGHLATTDEVFLRELGELEDEVARTVSLCTGDREFPDDLRQRILYAIANNTVSSRPIAPRAEVVAEVLICRDSSMVTELHTLFHDVARRRVKTRFGLLSDSPAGNVERRDAHDAGSRS